MAVNKIISFPESNNQVSNKRNKAESSDLNKKGSFALVLEKTKVTEVISLENRKAVCSVDLNDLLLAENLLNSLSKIISKSASKDLEKLHRLEGLIHFYQV